MDDNVGMVSKRALAKEHGKLVDEKFLRGLSTAQAERLAEIEQELDRLEAPRVEASRKEREAEFSTIDGRIAEIKATIEKRATDRPQTKTAGSY